MNIKKILKITSVISILAFAILYFAELTHLLNWEQSDDLMSIFVIVYLVSSIKFYQLDLKEKDEEIRALKSQLNKIKGA